ncbi:hypothetical protein ACPXCE_28730 [Streptomyces sp. DT24]|uniref:hypothetical protein n=1 Tax=Streptomyces sp. DT24 TaxID=3416520 RepID=UPI003CFB1618
MTGFPTLRRLPGLPTASPRAVGALAVGTDEPAHLAELLDALAAEADEETIHEHRALLRKCSSGQPA